MPEAAEPGLAVEAAVLAEGAAVAPVALAPAAVALVLVDPAVATDPVDDAGLGAVLAGAFDVVIVIEGEAVCLGACGLAAISEPVICPARAAADPRHAMGMALPARGARFSLTVTVLPPARLTDKVIPG